MEETIVKLVLPSPDGMRGLTERTHRLLNQLRASRGLPELDFRNCETKMTRNAGDFCGCSYTFAQKILPTLVINWNTVFCVACRIADLKNKCTDTGRQRRKTLARAAGA
ncbi:MAG TPA: hypothetical protein VFY05_04760 [Candidatus Angelobacter sp.]|nr:hypothetical protein [Candidatus Angelobacter sp.]